MAARNGPRQHAGTAWFNRRKRLIIVSVLCLLLAAIAGTMIIIGSLLRDRLLDDSRTMTRELAEVIAQGLSRLMIDRNPGHIQRSLEIISAGDSSVVRAVILDKNGKVAYSSTLSDIGAVLDRDHDPSCTGCHSGRGVLTRDTTRIVAANGRDVLRHVTIIRNEPACHGCHRPSDITNGKLMIDRSVKGTYSLIAGAGLIVGGAGAVCVLVLGPFLFRILSKGLDRYIDEIVFKSRELTILYMIVERLSKTIELDELKAAVVDMTRELFSAVEIDLITPRNTAEYSGIRWTADGTVERRIPQNEDPYRDLIAAWLRGEVTRERIIGDGTTVCMPVAKGDTRYGLIFVRRADRPFDEHDRELMRAMEGHMAVAFDNAALYHIAITDELTGLYSKRYFRTMIDKKVRQCETYGEKLTLLMIDIDDFKKVNDTYGHPAGDAVLRAAARRTLDAVRQGDLVFRYGGEEFAVLLPSTDSAAGALVAERIRDAVGCTSCAAGAQQLRVTVSIGAASIPAHARTIRDLVSEADAALYAAKRTGKNRVVVCGSPLNGQHPAGGLPVAGTLSGGR